MKLSRDETTTETVHGNMTAPSCVQMQPTATGQFLRSAQLYTTVDSEAACTAVAFVGYAHKGKHCASKSARLV